MGLFSKKTEAEKKEVRDDKRDAIDQINKEKRTAIDNTSDVKRGSVEAITLGEIADMAKISNGAGVGFNRMLANELSG